MINPRTPVLVGSGQVTQKINNPFVVRKNWEKFIQNKWYLKKYKPNIYYWTTKIRFYINRVNYNFRSR